MKRIAQEFWATLGDTLVHGDWPGHLRSFRRVVTGQVDWSDEVVLVAQPDEASAVQERFTPAAETPTL